MRHAIHKHIYKVGRKYSITKSINNKNTYFGSFDNINEAIEYRDKLIANNWQPLPETDKEKLEKNIKEYYLRLSVNSKKLGYVVRNDEDEYLAGIKTIEEALYYRDLYRSKPKNKAPKPKDIDLKTDNPYLKNGLKYPLPERLILPENNSGYGKGTIVQKGKTSFHVHHGSKGNGVNSYVCACPTIEMAEYVKAEMNKVNWDMSKLQRIIDDYPKYYTQLLFFYQYISKHRVWNQKTKHEKIYKGWEITIPKEYLENEKNLEKIGPYKNIEDALFERDFLVEHDWNYDLLVETIDDSKNPYYDMDLPTYPTRKIRNISKRNYREKELTEVMELIKEDSTLSQREIADKLHVSEVTIRNWLKNLYNTNYTDFKRLVLDGINPLDVLEKNEQIIQPDLSTAKPNNYNGYVHYRQKENRYQVRKENEYYGSYESEKLARKIAKDLMKCDFDKSKLKAIQKKHGYTSPVMSKRWVYKQGRKWAVRRKNKAHKMLTYGVYHDKRIAVLVRDMLLMYGWNIENMTWIEDTAIMTIEMIDNYQYTMFGKTTLEDIIYIETSDKVQGINKTKSGKYSVVKAVNGKVTYFGTYATEEKAVEVIEFLKDNNWDKELLNVMREMGEI